MLQNMLSHKAAIVYYRLGGPFFFLYERDHSDTPYVLDLTNRNFFRLELFQTWWKELHFGGQVRF